MISISVWKNTSDPLPYAIKMEPPEAELREEQIQHLAEKLLELIHDADPELFCEICFNLQEPS